MLTQDQDQQPQQQGEESVFGTPRDPGEAARQAVDEMVEAGMLDKVFDQVGTGELRLTGEGGFLPAMMKQVLEGRAGRSSGL